MQMASKFNEQGYLNGLANKLRALSVPERSVIAGTRYAKTLIHHEEVHYNLSLIEKMAIDYASKLTHTATAKLKDERLATPNQATRVTP